MDAIRNSGTGTLPAPKDSHSPAPLSAEQVYHDYAPRVYNVARKMVRTDVDAEDVTQDVLLQVVRSLPSFRGESAFPTWLHRVTVNAALAHRRRRAVREDARVADPMNRLLEASGADAPGRRWMRGPDVPLVDRETARLIGDAVDGLPEMYRRVFVLADLEGLPNAAVAAALGLSLPAVKSRLHRARHLLRKALAPHFGDVTA
jgi:RNA polymerase sigma-70 factor (ECF subfamily)